MTHIEPGGEDTASPPKAAGKAGISDAERELYGGRLRHDQSYVRHAGPLTRLGFGHMAAALPRMVGSVLRTGWETDRRALTGVVVAQLGRLHAVFACVGAPSSKRPVAEAPLREFAAVHEANTLSLVSTWHAVADRARRDSTAVLAVGSDAGQAARANNGPYSAAKAALEALVTTLAKEEHQHGVRVNLIAPSLIDSPLAAHVMALKGVTDPDAYFAQLPWGRPLALDEVAAACIELAAAAHWSYVTGQIYPLGALR
ncbi:SDR family oxidoreductase [Streptomyces sp. CSDS2]|uniref:SDR family oxidoreductase n=1 Tax=Streptomyces sp. CSDS2 TaxID=3055051 RepID=UPI0025AED821|nr:SDR family oxidoreductase [Streptomyces sp. CSDS2]MDN3260832.1 SDR family oxidoreductase [Streptomyces sp. CSDS2]